MSYIDDLNDAAARAQAAADSAEDSTQILYDVANGDVNATVTTESGEVKTVAKAIADLEAKFGEGLYGTATEEVTLADGQTNVVLSTVRTTNMSLFIEGAREFDYAVVDENTFTLPESFPEGTRIWAVGLEFYTDAGSSPVESSTGTSRSLSDWASGQIYAYLTVADMKAAEVANEGDVLQTLGYSEVGDGGGNTYIAVNFEAGREDGGSYINLTGTGMQAQGLFPNGINVRQFGANESSDDQSEFFEAAAAYSVSKSIRTGMSPIVRVPNGQYRITSDTTSRVTWWIDPDTFFTGLPGVDPTNSTDTSRLKGSMVRFFGTEQNGTLILGDTSFSAQKVMGKAVTTGQVCGWANNGGAGLVGVAQTSTSTVANSGQIGSRTVGIADNLDFEQAVWADYVEGYKLPGVSAIVHGQEVTMFNDSGITTRRNPLQQPDGGSDFMVGTWYSSGGFYGDDGTGAPIQVDGVVTTAVGIIGKDGGKFDRGITVYEGALSSSNEALSVASGQRIAWYAPNATETNSKLSCYLTSSRPNGDNGQLTISMYRNGFDASRWNYYFTPTYFTAEQDNFANLGRASNRWATVYAGTGTISTSDRNKKQQIVDPDEAELAVGRNLRIRRFKFNDAVAEKGSDNARKHFGFIAQEVITAFEDQGLDPFEYGAVCYDSWDAQEAQYDSEGNMVSEAKEAGEIYSVRYDECYALMMAAKLGGSE